MADPMLPGVRERDLTTFRYEMRMAFLYSPQTVTKRYADLHTDMSEHWLGLWFTTRRRRYLWLAVKAAFLAGWTDATGSTYSYDANPRNRPIITGLTA